MSAIILVGVRTAGAQVRFAEYERRTPIVRACGQLATAVAEEIAGHETEAKCLASDLISDRDVRTMLQNFSEDCAETVVTRLGPRFDQYGDHDIRFSRAELAEMFDRHYGPVYARHCSNRGEGDGMTARAGAVTSDR